MTIEYDNFPRGFYFAPGTQKALPGFSKVELLPNLFVHEWCNTSCAGNDENFIVVIGDCVPIFNQTVTSAAQDLYDYLTIGEDEFFDRLTYYSGRYVVFFGSRDSVKILNDAVGMRSVFYSEGFELVASHARLVEQLLGGRLVLRKRPFARGFPGNLVPHKRTRILTPNTLIDTSAKAIRRFWPNKPQRTSTVAVEAEYVLESASSVIRNLGASQKIKTTVTAGSDSRVILACALASGVEFDAYTYGVNYRTARDRAMAAEICATVNVEHSVPNGGYLDPTLAKALSRANYTKHHWDYVQGLMEWIDDPKTIVLMGLMLEIGRGVTAVNLPDANPPSDGRAMAELHFRTMPNKRRMSIEAADKEEYLEFSAQAFDGWLETIGGFTPEYMDPFVQFYWEHRMPTWLGPTMAERDFYASPVSPFNSRRILESMLSVTKQEQIDGAISNKVVEMIAPELMKFPINPPKWPLT